MRKNKVGKRYKYHHRQFSRSISTFNVCLQTGNSSLKYASLLPFNILRRVPSPNILILRSHTFPVSTQSRADIDGPTHFLTSFTMYVVKRREREMGKKSGEKRERGILISAATTTTTADVEYIWEFESVWILVWIVQQRAFLAVLAIFFLHN